MMPERPPPIASNRQTNFQRFAGCVFVNSNKARHAAAFGVFAAHSVAGTFWRHHDHVDAVSWLRSAEVHVQAVGERNCSTSRMLSWTYFL